METTDAGRRVRFIPQGEALMPECSWETRGEVPSDQLTQRGARVAKLVNALHDWWDASYGRLGPQPAIAGAWNDEGEE